VTAINSRIPSSKVSASLSSDSKITLSGQVSDLQIRNFSTDLPRSMNQSLGIQKVVGSNINDEILLPSSLSNQVIQNRLHNVFEHFLSMRTELGVASSTAQKFVDSTQNTLVDLNEDISKLEDADMAELLTNLQKLLTNKEAAQATFSRLSSKNLFDFLG
jgi:flagellin-like hook-associated protein FlgL